MSAVSCGIPLIERAAAFADRTAIVDPQGSYSYADLLRVSGAAAAAILRQVQDGLLGQVQERTRTGKTDLDEARICFLTAPDFRYPATQWGIWRAGGVAVPLCPAHPPAELDYVVQDSQATVIVADPEFDSIIRPIAEANGATLLLTSEFEKAKARSRQEQARLPKLSPRRRAMMLYTSGTTSRPKGVVTTHGNIAAQIQSLVQAWEWSSDDSIANILPLHHIHGIINVLSCALWSGARCEMLPNFDAEAIWQRFIDAQISLFMAVPTIYSRLIASWDQADAAKRSQITAGCGNLRLMVCGSAALPVPVLEKWKEVSGHVLLERYGMTEIGMGLSNPLHGERRPGCVGLPLPGVEVRLVDEQGRLVGDGDPGEIQVRGDNVFLEYWCRPDATRESFVDGFFKTGDIAVRENGIYRILGRSSVDIIKTGGYKVSALEIESVLGEHPSVAQCTVVGTPDPEWGERVAAVVVLKGKARLTLGDLRQWAKNRLAAYKAPTRLLTVDELPRNAMGKVMKPQVAELFEPPH